MDLFLGRGVNTCLLIPRISTFSSNLTLLFYRRSRVAACGRIQYSEKPQNNAYPAKNYNILCDRYKKIIESGLISCNVKTIHYSASLNSTSSTKSDDIPNKDCYTPPVVKKPSIFQRMKQMTKDYWHILIPVHIVTSLGWISIFYIAAKNGVDIVKLLEALNLSEKYLEMLRGSSAGHWAVTYALYKVFTPFRYTVTVGGTTMCIRYLRNWGYLKIVREPKLEQAIKCAEQHKVTYGKSNISNKSNQPQSQKT